MELWVIVALSSACVVMLMLWRNAAESRESLYNRLCNSADEIDGLQIMVNDAEEEMSRRSNNYANQLFKIGDEINKAEATHAYEASRFRDRIAELQKSLQTIQHERDEAAEQWLLDRAAWNKERQSLIASVEYWKNGTSTESAKCDLTYTTSENAK